MNIRGIDQLEDESAWSEQTQVFISDYFNKGTGNNYYPSGVFDVTVDIVVQETSKESIFKLRRRNNKRVLGGRGLQEEPKSLEVTYNQRAIYKTADPIEYDGVYVATRPFSTQDGIVAYIASLQGLSTHYDDITSISSVRVDPPPPFESVQEPDDGNTDGNEKGGGNDSNLGIIIGSVCGGVVLIAALAFFVYRRKRNARDEYLEPVGNGPQSSMRQPHDDDVETNSRGTINSRVFSDGHSDASSGDSDPSTASSFASSKGSSSKKSFGSFKWVTGSSSRNSQRSNLEDEEQSDRSSPRDMLNNVTMTGSETMLHVVAPAGKLGVIVDTPPGGGPAYVCEIKDSCPIIDQIRLEDKIIAVDDEDVQTMTAVNVSKMLARRARNPERKITILREQGGDGSADEPWEGQAGADRISALQSTASSSILPMTENPMEETTNEEWVHIVAPSGKLGVVLVTPEPPESGPAYVFNIRDDSPLMGKVRLGDKIMTVDDEDVREMTAINVSKLLGSKSTNEERKISILRANSSVSDSESDSGSSTGSGSGSDSGGDGEEPTEPGVVAGVVSQSAASSAEDAEDGGKPLSSHATSSVEESGSDKNASPSEPSEKRIEIIAPAGKLGVVVDSPPAGGSAYVSDIKEESPLRGEIHLGDRILLVDGEDVSKLKAIHVSSECTKFSYDGLYNLTIRLIFTHFFLHPVIFFF
ncbi:hypothetical protein ACHAXR_003904 [Thalassiosira sp. AJA248-18]